MRSNTRVLERKMLIKYQLLRMAVLPIVRSFLTLKCIRSSEQEIMQTSGILKSWYIGLTRLQFVESAQDLSLRDMN